MIMNELLKFFIVRGKHDNDSDLDDQITSKSTAPTLMLLRHEEPFSMFVAILGDTTLAIKGLSIHMGRDEKLDASLKGKSQIQHCACALNAQTKQLSGTRFDSSELPSSAFYDRLVHIGLLLLYRS